VNSFRRLLPSLALALGAFLITACARHSGPVVRANWLTDFAAAQAQAKAENKLVLLDFTGSDWCEWCMKMDEESLDTPTFKTFADANLVLVELDFPAHKTLPAALVQQNTALQGRFGAEGYPTFVVLGPDGKTLATLVGYQPGGPESFIAQLKKFAPKT